MQSLQLRTIKRISGQPTSLAAVSLGEVVTTAQDVAAIPSNLRVIVGRGDVENAPEAIYECPVYTLQAASPTLRDLIADVIEYQDVAELRLPSSLSARTFETIGLYMEYFYSVAVAASSSSPTIGTTTTTAKAGAATVEAIVSALPLPTTFSPPLHWDALYSLSSWERHFVLERLLCVRSVLECRQGSSSSSSINNGDGTVSVDAGVLLAELVQAQFAFSSNWVDALGGNSGNSSSACSGRSIIAFTLEEKRLMFDELCRVLEAATQLAMPPLQSLCAALVGNFLVDLPPEDLLALARPPGTKGAIPALTEKERAELLQSFPWLSPSTSL